MVIRQQKEKVEVEPVKEKVVEEQAENNIPMIPNYLDLILGEVNAIRVILENRKE